MLHIHHEPWILFNTPFTHLLEIALKVQDLKAKGSNWCPTRNRSLVVDSTGENGRFSPTSLEICRLHGRKHGSISKFSWSFFTSGWALQVQNPPTFDVVLVGLLRVRTVHGLFLGSKILVAKNPRKKTRRNQVTWCYLLFSKHWLWQLFSRLHLDESNRWLHLPSWETGCFLKWWETPQKTAANGSSF